MAFDENGVEFSWHDVRIIEKAACCYFRVPGKIQSLEMEFQETEFDTFYEAERVLLLLRKEEDEWKEGAAS